MEATSIPTFKSFFHSLTQHLLQNHKKCQIIFCPTDQQQNRFMPGWLSLLLVDGQSYLPKLLPIIFSSTKKQLWLFFYHSFIQGQSFCVSLCLQLQPGRLRAPTSPLPPSNSLSPIKFSTQKVRQTLLQLDTSKSKGPDGIPAVVLKTCASGRVPILNKLFQLSYTLGTFPTSWKQAHVFPIPKKATCLIHSTIVPLQSLQSSLKQWRQSSLNNFLPSLKQTIFSLISSTAFERPGD